MVAANTRMEKTDMIVALDHLQLALPQGAEDAMRGFYCGVLGLSQTPKPAELANRGGFWARAGDVTIHFSVDPNFHAATKAHPAFLVEDLGFAATRVAQAGQRVIADTALPKVQRFFTHDPVGNRIEMIAQR